MPALSVTVWLFFPLVSKQEHKGLEKKSENVFALFLIFSGTTALGDVCSVANDCHAYDENTVNKMILLWA